MIFSDKTEKLSTVIWTAKHVKRHLKTMICAGISEGEHLCQKLVQLHSFVTLILDVFKEIDQTNNISKQFRCVHVTLDLTQNTPVLCLWR